MIEHTRGDIFSADTEALVNPVNTSGVMSKGLAAQFKRSYPDNYAAYRAACADDVVAVGRMLLFETGSERPRYIVNFPTKQAAKSPSRLEDIEAGLADLVRVIREHEITSIAVPGLGAGVGGLDWRDVRPRIEAALAAVPDVRVLLYDPLPD